MNDTMHIGVMMHFTDHTATPADVAVAAEERGLNANYQVYGRRKMKAALRREHGINLDKDRIARAQRPNLLWVSDFTYVATWSGFVYTAFVIDVHSRMIVGWRTASTMTTPLVMDALNMAVFSRRLQLINGVIAHSDAGSRYVSVAYTERLAEIGARPSIGSIGDSYDNSLAETLNGLYKTELIRRQGPWRNVEHVELATLAWVEWFNNQRLHGELGDVPPAEFEHNYYAQPELEARSQHQPGPDAKDRPIHCDNDAVVQLVNGSGSWMPGILANVVSGTGACTAHHLAASGLAGGGAGHCASDVAHNHRRRSTRSTRCVGDHPGDDRADRRPTTRRGLR